MPTTFEVTGPVEKSRQSSDGLFRVLFGRGYARWERLDENTYNISVEDEDADVLVGWLDAHKELTYRMV